MTDVEFEIEIKDREIGTEFMEETDRAIGYPFRHDPYVIGGLLLIGFASYLFMH